MALRGKGDLYFNDPPYSLGLGADDLAKELVIHGVFRLAPDASMPLLVDDLSCPNGIALSPDRAILYVANSDTNQPKAH